MPSLPSGPLGKLAHGHIHVLTAGLGDASRGAAVESGRRWHTAEPEETSTGAAMQLTTWPRFSFPPFHYSSSPHDTNALFCEGCRGPVQGRPGPSSLDKHHWHARSDRMGDATWGGVWVRSQDRTGLGVRRHTCAMCPCHSHTNTNGHIDIKQTAPRGEQPVIRRTASILKL